MAFLGALRAGKTEDGDTNIPTDQRKRRYTNNGGHTEQS